MTGIHQRVRKPFSLCVTRGKFKSNKKTADGVRDFSYKLNSRKKRKESPKKGAQFGRKRKEEEDFHECARHNWLSGSPIMATAFAPPRKKIKSVETPLVSCPLGDSTMRLMVCRG